MPLYNLRPKKRTCKILVVNYKLVAIDISIILATSFVLNCQDLRAALFLITLKEIDYKIQDQEATN
jgi:hypothetical protein